MNEAYKEYKLAKHAINKKDDSWLSSTILHNQSKEFQGDIHKNIWHSEQ